MKFHSVLALFVFSSFLVIGYTYSTRFYQPAESLPAASAKIITTQGIHPIATMDNGQRSLLLIGTDKLSKASLQLKSIWLATYIPNGTSIQLFPIYPSGNKPTSDFGTQLAQAFSLSGNGRSLELNQSFIGLLEKHNFWWSGYVIFDDISVAKIIDLAGVRLMNGESLSGPGLMSVFRDGAGDSIISHSSQLAFFQSLCHEFAKGDSTSEVPQLAQLVPSHILTDLDIGQLEQELDSLSTNGHAPTCRFPSLEISRIEP